jgi:hypothetical protein
VASGGIRLVRRVYRVYDGRALPIRPARMVDNIFAIVYGPTREMSGVDYVNGRTESPISFKLYIPW